MDDVLVSSVWLRPLSVTLPGRKGSGSSPPPLEVLINDTCTPADPAHDLMASWTEHRRREKDKQQEAGGDGGLEEEEEAQGDAGEGRVDKVCWQSKKNNGVLCGRNVSLYLNTQSFFLPFTSVKWKKENT